MTDEEQRQTANSVRVAHMRLDSIGEVLGVLIATHSDPDALKKELAQLRQDAATAVLPDARRKVEHVIELLESLIDGAESRRSAT